MNTVDRKPSHVQSVDRAISVLELLSRNGLSGVTEIANHLAIHKSTAYRLLATLEARGLVEQDVETEKYRLGFGVVALASAVTAELDIVQRARPVCDQLSDETEETTTITVLEGDEPVVIHQSTSSASVLGVDWTGQDTPVHCTAAGKVFLAHMPKRRRERILARPLQRFTDNTIVEPARLREQFSAVLTDGYAYTVEELEVGLNAVGAPIFGIDGSVIAVVTVSGPAFRLPMASIPRLGERVKQAATDISRRIGFHPVSSKNDR
jgi:DNA-binding IclR family transcriptional regulator